MEQDSNHTEGFPNVPPPPPPRPMAAKPVPVYLPPSEPQKRKGSFIGGVLRYIFMLVFLLSIVMNFYLFMLFGAGEIMEREYRSGSGDQKIALIDLKGMITLPTAYDFRKMLKKAADDVAVKGVVIVVNCPGGYVAPSNMMNKYIRDFKEQTGKKIYSSTEMVNASGAYWTTAGTDKIFAQENAMVGSIGVIYQNFVVQKLMEEKLGVMPIVRKSSKSPFKDTGSMFRMPTETDEAEIKKKLDKVHDRFVAVVSEGREGLTAEEVWPLATGEVFDGQEALEKKLIDAVGFLDDAINDMIDTLDLTNPRVVRYAQPPSLREILSAKSQASENPLDIEAQLAKLAGMPRIQAIWMGN